MDGCDVVPVHKGPAQDTDQQIPIVSECWLLQAVHFCCPFSAVAAEQRNASGYHSTIIDNRKEAELKPATLLIKHALPVTQSSLWYLLAPSYWGPETSTGDLSGPCSRSPLSLLRI